MIIPKKSVQNITFASFIALLFIAFNLTLFSTLNTSQSHLRNQLQVRFTTAKSVFLSRIRRDIATYSHRLHDSLKTDIIKQIVSQLSDSKANSRQLLDRLRRKAQVDIALLIDSSGTLIISSIDDEPIQPETETFKQSTLFNLSEISMIKINGRYYVSLYTSIAPIKNTTEEDIWLVTGIELKNWLTPELEELTSFPVIAFSSDKMYSSTPVEAPVASTALALAKQSFLYANNPSQQHNAILPVSQRVKAKFAYIKSATTLSGQSLEFFFFPLPASGAEPIVIAFYIYSNDMYIQAEHLALDVIFIILISLILAYVLAARIGLRITQLLDAIRSSSKDIQHGRYTSLLPKTSIQEVASLNKAFVAMRESIHARESDIQDLAFRNSITHLPNRNRFIQYIDESIEASDDQTGLAIFILDINRFKQINDSLGHHFGDRVLQCVAQRLKIAKPLTDFYAHLEGDSFAILLTDLVHFSIASFASQYMRIFDTPFIIDNVTLTIEASMGISIYPDHGTTAQELLHCADLAKQTCKLKTTSYELYQETIAHNSHKDLHLITELRPAIAEEKLSLYYQPKVCLKTHQIIAIEALSRWIHPEYGFISPTEFIPLAEKSGLIRDLTKWAIESALKQHIEWQKRGINLQFAVNISAFDLVDLSLPPYISERLTVLQVDPQALMFEVTESTVMSDPALAIKALGMIKKMGIKLSIDDFGTGYSSMAQLKKMPVSELKIDRSFVTHLGSNEEDVTIVKSTIELAHNLGLTVVAEGIEDENTYRLLSELGCETAQGYYISKPLPADEFIDWLLPSTYWQHNKPS